MQAFENGLHQRCSLRSSKAYKGDGILISKEILKNFNALSKYVNILV